MSGIATPTCATRIGHLTGKTGGLNGSYYLDAATVCDDNARDTLLGGNATDAFFQGLGDNICKRRVSE